MLSPEQFLVEKGILISPDLDTKWNLKITRDCYVGTSKRIVEAMKEYLALYIATEKKRIEAESIRWTTPPWIEKALEPDSGPVSSGLPCDFDTDNPEKVKPI